MEKCPDCGCDLVSENTNHVDDQCDDCYEKEDDEDFDDDDEEE